MILISIYLISIARVFFLASSLDNESRNSSSAKNITISIPKESKVGYEINVVVYYYPNILELFNKQVLKQIIFYDQNNANSDKNSLKISTGTLSLFPYYETFTFKIPQHVCPENIVYDTCKLVQTKKGNGKITLIHEPGPLKSLSGEGYQGDGEKIEVPILIVE